MLLTVFTYTDPACTVHYLFKDAACSTFYLIRHVVLIQASNWDDHIRLFFFFSLSLCLSFSLSLSLSHSKRAGNQLSYQSHYFVKDLHILNSPFTHTHTQTHFWVGKATYKMEGHINKRCLEEQSDLDIKVVAPKKGTLRKLSSNPNFINDTLLVLFRWGADFLLCLSVRPMFSL